MKILLALFFLNLPEWFEVYRDRKGDAHPNSDWKLRGLTCLLVGGVVTFIFGRFAIVPFLCYSFTSACFFSAIFPYWINYVHLRNGVTHVMHPDFGGPIAYGLLTQKEKFNHIVNHLSDSAWPDKLTWWRHIGWKARMSFHIDILLAGITVFIVCYWRTHG